MYELKKKEDIDEKKLKKEKYILMLMIFTIVILLISTSYALLTNYDETNDVVTFKTGNLNMSVKTDTINLSGKLPESDESGLLNSEPIIINLTNTGTMNIKGYDVKLISEDGKTSTLSDSYIKYAISLDNGKTYKEANNLENSNNIIYKGYNLAIGNSKIIYLKVWIDEEAGTKALNKIYYGSIQVDLYQEVYIPGNVIVEEAITSKSLSNPSCKTTIVEDGITYISGTSDCIDFNYLWYSGKMWRITAIYPNGSIKMVTDGVETTISYGTDAIFYTDESNNSYAYQWLNQDFLDTLYNYENIIVTNNKWNLTATSTIANKLSETTMIESKVGLLNTYEYYQSYQNATPETGYLRNGFNSFLLNSVNSSNIWLIYNTGMGEYRSPSEYMRGIRPSIILKPGIEIEGLGTIDNPFRISGDKNIIYNEKLSNRNIGEYINFDNSLYRIISIENDGSTKIRMNGNIPMAKFLASSNIYGSTSNVQSDAYWDYYLNNTWYNSISSKYKNMLVKGNYYLGSLTSASSNYKGTICKTVSNIVSTKNCEKTDNTWTGYVGTFRIGELFAAHSPTYLSHEFFTLITPLNNGNNLSAINQYGNLNIYPYNDNVLKYSAAVPTLNLSNNVIITSGTGLYNEPFEITLN